MVKIEEINVGEHVTVCGYSDRTSYTVIRKTKSMIEIQKDFQEIDKENWKPEWVSGGFAGHCTNQNYQKWIVKPDPKGITKRVFAKEDGCLKHLIKGASPFYDYNF